jgi:hypothetical protein
MIRYVYIYIIYIYYIYIYIPSYPQFFPAAGSYQPLHDLRREAFVVSTKPWTLRLAEVARRAQRPPVKMEKLLQVGRR